MLALAEGEGAPGDDRDGHQRAEVDTAKFDLSFTFAEQASDASHPAAVTLEYADDLFTEQTAQDLLHRFVRVMGVFGADTRRSLDDLDVLTPDEHRWTAVPDAAAVRSDTGHAFLSRFEQQVRDTPDRTALVFGDTTLTFRELDVRANRLAHHLIGLGTVPDRPVPLLMRRSADMFNAMLAVLKSGAAFLPLDPRNPADRLADILDEVGGGLLLTDRDCRAHDVVRGLADTMVVVEADDHTVTSEEPESVPEVPRGPADLAYVVYTSGSTGRPKGVAVSHANLDYLVRGMEESGYYLPEPLVSAWTASAAFDASVQQWAPICRGDTILVVDDDTRDDPGYLAEELLRHRVTYLDLTPSHWELVRDSLLPRPADAPPLRLTLGGEAISAKAWTDLVEGAADDRVVAANTYGPTETTVNASHTELSGEHPHIGQALPGARAYVLDDRLRPAPTGVTGELYVSGEGVAHGYLGRPGLTAQRFVADPYGPPGTRMYRTGDRVSRTFGGDLRFHGRADDQVKIRGFRIELGEIESVLSEHASVAHAAVLVREDHPGDPRLVAYLVAVEGRRIDAEEVRAHVSRSLPEYMVPAATVVVEALPLTSSGKLDKRALPAPEYGSTGIGRAPRTPQEEVLCALFAEVLGLERVGIDDSFFDLGGHSLLAARLVGRVGTVLGNRLRVKDVFRTPTVAGLLAEAGRDGTEGALDVLLPLQADGDRPPLFCVHPGMGMSWCYSGLVRHLADDQPLYGLQTRALTTPGALPGSVSEIAEEYLERIRGVQPHGPYRLLGWSFGGLVVHEMAVRLQETGEEVSFLGLMDSYPVPAGARRTEITHGEVLAMMLDDPATEALLDGGQELDRDAVVRELRGKDPVLADLEETDVATLVDAAVNHARVMNLHTPRSFAGDAIFFRATRGRSRYSPRVEYWQEHVDGLIDVHDIDSTHMGMTRPEPMARIGRLVSDRLETITSEQLRS